MNKFLLFSLLITTAANHGMEQENKSITIFTPEILPHLTQALCASHNYVSWDVKKIGRYGIQVDTRALSKTNKVLRDYYTQDDTKKFIIRLCAIRNSFDCRHDDWHYAHDLGYWGIKKKIQRLLDINFKQDMFTDDDANDPWYLNMITNEGTLLYKSLLHGKLQVANFIIKNVPDLYFCYRDNQDVLGKIAHQRCLTLDHCFPKQQAIEYLEIAKRLFAKGIDPNGCENERSWTPLMTAVLYRDKELVYQLLLHGADPYKNRPWFYKPEVKHNAFDNEPEKGWLQAIINQVELDKKDALDRQAALDAQG